MKSKVTLNCETNLLEESRNYQINLSKTLEEALINKLSFIKGDTENMDIALTKKELDKEEKKLTKIQTKVSSLRSIISQAEDLILKEEEKRIKEEKKKVEALTKCINCGSFFGDKKAHKFNSGLVCNTCFMSGTPEDIKRWTTIKDGEKKEKGNT